MHAHDEVGDPRAVAALLDVVQSLAAALRTGGDVASGTDRARTCIAAYADDANPRTRTQVRALRTVVALVANGDPVEALALLDGPLLRSFPGQAEFGASARRFPEGEAG